MSSDTSSNIHGEKPAQVRIFEDATTTPFDIGRWAKIFAVIDLFILYSITEKFD